MLVIRLLRTGKKNQPFFKIVVTDKKNPPRGGRFLENLGSLNPLKTKRRPPQAAGNSRAKGAEFPSGEAKLSVQKDLNLNRERIKYWLSVGAKPSARIHNLLVDEKIIEGKKINVFKKSKKEKEKPVEEKLTAPEKPVEEKPKEEKVE